MKNSIVIGLVQIIILVVVIFSIYKLGVSQGRIEVRIEYIDKYELLKKEQIKLNKEIILLQKLIREV